MKSKEKKAEFPMEKEREIRPVKDCQTSWTEREARDLRGESQERDIIGLLSTFGAQ